MDNFRPHAPLCQPDFRSENAFFRQTHVSEAHTHVENPKYVHIMHRRLCKHKIVIAVAGVSGSSIIHARRPLFPKILRDFCSRSLLFPVANVPVDGANSPHWVSLVVFVRDSNNHWTTDDLSARQWKGFNQCPFFFGALLWFEKMYIMFVYVSGMFEFLC